MKKSIFVFGLLLFFASIAGAQQDMTYQHFYESLRFVATTVQYGMVSNLFTVDTLDGAIDTDNDGFYITEIGQNPYTWAYAIIHLRTRRYVMISISNAPNYPSSIDQSRARVYNLTNASQRSAFLNEINAAKTRLENNAR
jgi:hypothetical protein